MGNDFYMQRNGGSYCDIPLKADNWDEAIAEAKASVNYSLTKLPSQKRHKFGINDYVEMYRGKIRKSLSFDDLKDKDIYRKIY